jgi:hypothetical protein
VITIPKSVITMPKRVITMVRYPQLEILLSFVALDEAPTRMADKPEGHRRGAGNTGAKRMERAAR